MADTVTVAQIFKPFSTDVLLQVLLIVAVAALLAILVRKLTPWIANRMHGQRRLFLLAAESVLRLLVILGAFLLCILLIIEPTLQNMVALFGAVGLAVDYALKDYTSSLVAGVVAVGEMPYRKGDWEVDRESAETVLD